MSFMAAIAGAILSGVGSASEGRRETRNSRDQREFDREQATTNFNNQLRFTEYGALLEDSLRQRRRSEIAKGWDNWGNPAGKPNREPNALPSLNDYLQRTDPDGKK